MRLKRIEGERKMLDTVLTIKLKKNSRSKRCCFYGTFRVWLGIWPRANISVAYGKCCFFFFFIPCMYEILAHIITKVLFYFFNLTLGLLSLTLSIKLRKRLKIMKESRRYYNIIIVLIDYFIFFSYIIIVFYLISPHD